MDDSRLNDIEFEINKASVDYDYNTLCHIHKLVADKLVLDQELGKIRTTPVNIGGTSWKPQFPIESQIKEELDVLLNQENKTKTEIAIEIMLSLMRRQIFIDGNKRASVIFANQYLIAHGQGLLVIPEKEVPDFKKLLVKYYEGEDISVINEFLKEKCWKTF